MKNIKLNHIRQSEELDTLHAELKDVLEKRINLDMQSPEGKPLNITNNLLQRLSLFAGLSITKKREKLVVEDVKLKSSHNFHDTVFSRNNLANLWSALLKLRYNDLPIDWESNPEKSRVINYEMIQGAQLLLQEDNVEEWLMSSHLGSSKGATYGAIPQLNLNIGVYEDEIEAYLDINGKDIPNTQILIAGTTGSGKSNLLAVLIHELRKASVETSYPVNFLLFDYKGEFSDPANSAWLNLFEVDKSIILNPIEKPLPFSPFKDFTHKHQNEINLYATELSQALLALDSTKISAKMSNRLAEAVISAYKLTKKKPVNFQLILSEYRENLSPKEAQNGDSITSVLNQLIRSRIFSDEDRMDLVKNSAIIKMDAFPKDGVLAKAIVYFTISKLNLFYESLPKQAVGKDFVEIRHYTIIDEAHYMLDFDNKPLRNLIAVGRNKGLSIILATQNMDSFKSSHFDFYANAQYPLIMKQQSMNDRVIKDLFGVTGNEFHEIKEAISNLQKGELLLKDTTAALLGMGKKYKKIKVTHLI